MLPSIGLCLHTAAARGRKTSGGGGEYLPGPPQISVEADTGHAPLPYLYSMRKTLKLETQSWTSSRARQELSFHG